MIAEPLGIHPLPIPHKGMKKASRRRLRILFQEPAGEWFPTRYALAFPEPQASLLKRC